MLVSVFYFIPTHAIYKRNVFLIYKIFALIDCQPLLINEHGIKQKKIIKVPTVSRLTNEYLKQKAKKKEYIRYIIVILYLKYDQEKMLNNVSTV